MCLTQDITVYDCLEIYSQEKKLTGEKNFICSKCSRNVTPIQIVYPYSSPKYLILGIQRIKKKFEDLTEMINNTKDDRLVGYPLENFDVTSFFIN
jgi:ubiquitin C-terminal hydrolase